MASIEDKHNAETLALQALVWIMSDQRRADRLLALTGMSADQLRASLSSSATLAAILTFLHDHEPDLIACAEALDVDPAILARAGSFLSLE